jgi:hypothetical protein
MNGEKIIACWRYFSSSYPVNHFQPIPAGIELLERFHIDAVSESGESTHVSKPSRKLLGFYRGMQLSGEIH